MSSSVEGEPPPNVKYSWMGYGQVDPPILYEAMDLRATYFVEDGSPSMGHLCVYMEGGTDPTLAFMQRNLQYLKRSVAEATLRTGLTVNRRIRSRLDVETRQQVTVVSIPTPDKQTRVACQKFIESRGGQFLEWVYPERRLSV